MRWLVWTVVVVLTIAILVFAHPYLFGLPGRIAESRLRSGLRTGMTRDQVLRLGRERDGNAGWDDVTQVQEFQYVDFGTICTSGGERFDVRFDNAMQVQSWTEKRWVTAC